jgi:hypothetical protein
MDFAEFTFFYDVREIRARRFPLTSWCQGDVAQSLDAEVFGEDQQPYVDVVLEPSEGGLLARLNVCISSIKGQAYHTPEDSKLLEGDTADRRLADMATVPRWNENCPRHGGGAKTA